MTSLLPDLYDLYLSEQGELFLVNCITGSWQPWQLRSSSTQQKQGKESSQTSLLPWPHFAGFCPPQCNRFMFSTIAFGT